MNVPAVPTVNAVELALVMAGAVGAALTVSVKLWCVGAAAVGRGDRDRVAALVPAAGVPASVAVPSPLSVKVTPAGSDPDSVIAAVGLPVVVTVNDPAVPTVNVAELPLVIFGACWMVMVSVCWIEPYALVAVSGIAYVPALFGVPAREAVPSPLSVNVTPGGRPDSPQLGAG